MALGLLDDWLAGTEPSAPAGMGHRVALPAVGWRGDRAASDILALARNGRAFPSLDTLIVTHGGGTLSESRIAIANQLRAHLRRVFPGAVGLFAELDSPISLRFPGPLRLPGPGRLAVPEAVAARDP